MGTEDNNLLVNSAARRGSRSVLLASLFRLNEESRSAKGVEGLWGRIEASGEQLGQGLEGIKCLPNAARG